ncbi:MAG: glycerophosphodiester phosphodiesterase [Chloroflexota bacterium]|nr:glycerophosphodiester phosphodiesterase [Chloroflexota bacterium]
MRQLEAHERAETHDERGNVRVPQTLTHRGASTLAPENTLAALSTAVELGVDYVEIDVHMTADDELVVIHDRTVDRTTNGTGPVRTFDLWELKRLDAGSWFYRPGAIPAWERSLLRVPTLREALDVVRGRAGVCIEIKKPDLYPGLEQRLLDILHDAGMLEGEAARSVMLQSFSVGSMRLLALLAPQLTRIQLVLPGHSITEGELDRLRGYAHGLGLHRGSVTRDLVRQAHDRDLLVHPYTVNSPEEMRRLLDLDVDGIISDNPVELKRVIREFIVDRQLSLHS